MIQPKAGTIICKPFISKKSTFTPTKTAAGDIQISEILAVGDEFVDDSGTRRYPNCKAGEIIIHEYTPHTGEVDFNEYRFVKFWQVLGEYKE